jgi:biopolymer transport protein TolQ
MLSIINQNEIFSMVWNAGAMVKLVLFLLLAFSITSWAIIFMKYRIIHRARKETNRFQDIFWRSKSLSVAYNESKDLRYSPVAELFRVGYQELKHKNATRNQRSPKGIRYLVHHLVAENILWPCERP